MRTRIRSLALAFTLVACPSGAWAQAVGGEFQVNTYATGFQSAAVVACDASGNFVVVWESEQQDGNGQGVFGRRYDASGNPLGAEFRVNTYTTNHQGVPAVASDPSGNFVVVWASYQQDGSGRGVFGQRYDSSGNPLGGEFQINTFTPGAQEGPAVSSGANGGFVVVWHSNDQSYRGVFGRRYDASGNPLGGEFQVNTYITNPQEYPAVASDANGGFVVVWHSVGQDGSFDGVFGRRYAPSGNPLGSEFQINVYTTNSQMYPAVASDPNGNFVVVWDHRYPNGSGRGVFGRRYDASGNPRGGEFQVNTYTTTYQGLPSWLAVASNARGDFVVVWDGLDQDGDGFGVSGRRYDVSGAALTGEFQVNTYTTNQQRLPAVASDATGKFVVVWTRLGQYSGTYGVFGQRFVSGPKGDFNSDARTDILFRHAVSGKNVVWYMDGITLTAGVFTNPDQLPDTNWQIVGTADFDADQKTDILWRHAVSGKNVVWYMDGITLTAGVFTNPDQLPDTNWRMVGTGDFSSPNDGRPDILWRHAASGKNVVWFMNGITLTAGVFTNPDRLPDTNWQMAGVGDFWSLAGGQDGKVDILWRHAFSGKNVLWYMDGINLTAGVFTNPDQLLDTNWRIVAVGDYSSPSDGKADILFRHQVSGTNVVWYMDGVTRTGGVYTNPAQLPDTNWRIVGPK